MPRGRPRKNPLPIEEEKIEPVKLEKEASKEKKKEDKFPECNRCHKKIISGEKNINLTYLTGMAPWHRNVSLDRVCLCSDCGKELNKMIDDWLIDEGKGVKEKYT
jgi:hypothetical protein